MKCSLVVLLAVLSVVMLSDTEAWRIRIRFRRFVRRVVKPIICHLSCKLVCKAATSGAPVCSPICGKVCGRRRRAPGEETAETLTKGFPSDFGEYDSNDDGFISVQEFADVLNLDPTQDGVKEAFSYADLDGDSLISPAEFQEAPWDFEDGNAEDE